MVRLVILFVANPPSLSLLELFIGNKAGELKAGEPKTGEPKAGDFGRKRFLDDTAEAQVDRKNKKNRDKKWRKKVAKQENKKGY